MKRAIIIMVLGFSLLQLDAQYGFQNGGEIKCHVIDSNSIQIIVGFDAWGGTGISTDSLFYPNFLKMGVLIGDLANPRSAIKYINFPKQDSISNITVTCPGYSIAGNPLNNNLSNSKTTKGVIRFWFSTIIDINKDSVFNTLIKQYGSDTISIIAFCSRSTLYSDNLGIFSRPGVVLQASIFLKNIKSLKQKSNYCPSFHNYPNLYNNLGYYRFSPSYSDVENDKIEFSHENCISSDASFKTILFKSGYSTLDLLKSYVGTWGNDGFGKPNKKVTPPKGINFDIETGELYFYKFKDESAYVNLCITESRKNETGIWLPISKSSLQYNLSFRNSTNNPPQIQFPDELSVIEGDTLTMDILLSDQDRNDTTQLWYSLTQTGMSVSQKSINSNKAEYKFIWITDSSHTVKPIFTQVFGVMDNQCSDIGLSSKAVKIRVLPRIKYENLSRDTTCNRLVYQVVHPKVPGNPRYQWEVKSKSGYYTKNFQSNGFITEPLPNDTYYITSIIVHDSLGFKPQTDTVILNQKPEIYFLGDTGFCQNTALDFRLDTAHLKDLALIRMTSSSGILKKSQLTGNLSGADSVTKLGFEIRDSRGCIARDSVVVKEFPQESRVWTAIPAGCSTGSQVFLNALWGDFRKRKTEIQNTDAYVVWKDSNVYLDPQKVPQSGFKNGTQVLDLFLSYNDSWQCRQRDTVKWLVEQPVEAVLKDTSICQNSGLLDLDELIVKPNLSQSDYQAIWKLVSSPAGVPSGSVMLSENRMNLGASQEKGRSGTYQFAVSFKKYAGGCTQWDTVKVAVVNEPVLTLSPQTLCRDREEYDLYKSVRVDGKPAVTGRFSWDSYNWDKKAPELGSYGIINGNLVPKDIVAGTWRVRYEGPLSGCMDTGYFTVRVFHSPVADIQMSSPQDLNIHAAELQATHSSYIEDNTKLTWLWDAGDTTSKSDTSSAFVFKYRYPKIVGDYPLELRVMSNMGCRDTARIMIAVTDNAGLSQVGLEAVYRINSQGEVLILNSAWELVDMRWFDLKGSEIGSPVAGVNVYRVVLKRGVEMLYDSGKWVKE